VNQKCRLVHSGVYWVKLPYGCLSIHIVVVPNRLDLQLHELKLFVSRKKSIMMMNYK
jgi:hypothetical protein